MQARPTHLIPVALALAAATVVFLLWPPRPEQTGRPVARLSLARAMAPGAPEGFALAIDPREFSFPEDHGPHPGFQTEWWYLSGNLDAGTLEKGRRRFGYQLTFFRSAVQPPGDAAPAASVSSWRSDQLYMAHLALTDVEENRFLSFERFARGALDLAGARTTPFRVWLEDWRVESHSAEDFFPLSLHASDGDASLDLTIAAAGPPVLHGEAGLSRKGTTLGNSSYYYSFTRLPTRGRLEVDGRTSTVEGSSWLDREWSTSALEEGVVGWDWFALQLSDGRDLMFYRLRRADGSTAPLSGGTIVESDGRRRRIDATEMELAESSYWRSPETGAVYPAGWRLTSRAAGFDLEVKPLVAAQEHTSTVLYWEGAVEVSGSSGADAVSGRGYVELTGYDPAPDGPRL